MTDTSLPTRFAESDFRVGNVLNRTASVLSRHFLTFFVITAVASLPVVVIFKGSTSAATDPGQAAALFGVGGLLILVLSILSQAVIVYAAFQIMRGQPVNLVESLMVGLRRFFPIIGLAIIMGVLVGLASLLLVVPGIILWTMWVVGTPVCIVERLGPWTSLKRSAQLTKGHRWKVFGLMFLLLLVSGVVGPTLELALDAIGGTILRMIGSLIWGAVWGAFYAIAVVVTYHDLRVVKEGVNIEQIASVFD